jgi:hypothetical protein
MLKFLKKLSFEHKIYQLAETHDLILCQEWFSHFHIAPLLMLFLVQFVFCHAVDLKLIKTEIIINNYVKYLSKTEPTDSTQNPKKNIGTPNLPIKTSIFPKKSIFGTLKV